MKKLFSSFFGKNNGDDAEEPHIPWMHTPSIYDYILDNLDPETGRLIEAGWTLPDEERRYADTKLRWVPGALDGTLGHHGSPDSENEKANLISIHLANIANHNDLKDKIALYNLLLEDDLVGYIDLAIDKITQSNIPPYPNVNDFVLFLLKNAPDRGPVKFAIAILGIMRSKSEIDDVSLLGKHEEFTLYSAVALSNILEEPEFALWDLAKAVDGWGKIHLVERLSSTKTAEIKSWLLLEGYRNSIMYEYLAHTCATAGDLRGAISADQVDDALLDATAEIIEALIAGGPAQDIDDYRDAAFVITRFLEHLQTRANNLTHLTVVDSILGFLSIDSWDTAEKELNGWDEQTRDSAIQMSQAIIQQPQWMPLALAGLKSEDNLTFYIANRAAQIVGIDTWEYHWRRLQNKPLEAHNWFQIMSHATHENIEMIMAFAAQALPLDQIATGAAEESGFGPDFAIHMCLDAILQELKQYPMVGWPLVAASLKSPVIRNRNMALRALSEWSRDNWGEEVESTLIESQLVEPRDDVRERIRKVLSGEPFE